MSTPMQKQYNSIKKKHQGSIVLFRLGDFYEAFNEDAKKISKILGITLTGRGKGENRVPMAGIPHHALDKYLPKLVKNGLKIVIADQVGDVESGKLVEREVTEVITPGMIVDENLIAGKANNFLAVVLVDFNKKKTEISSYICLFDASTSDIFLMDIRNDDENLSKLVESINKFECREIVVNESAFKEFSVGREGGKDIFTKNFFPKVDLFETMLDTEFDLDIGLEELKDAFDLNSLQSWGIDKNDKFIGVINACRRYLLDNEKQLFSLDKLKVIDTQKIVNIPWTTYRSLDILLDSQGSEENSLINHMDLTQTTSGRRKLHEWFINVEMDLSEITLRLDSVAEVLKITESQEDRQGLEDFLKSQVDYERFITKMQYNRLTPNRLKDFAKSILEAHDYQGHAESLEGKEKTILNQFKRFQLENLEKLAKKLDEAIVEGFNDFSEYGFINSEYNDELEKIVKESTEGKNYLKNLEKEEMQKTGITSLKVNYNKVYGYYIEVSKSNLSKVPDHYVRKQTLVNAERFITEELKKWEERILKIREIRLEKEKEIFDELVEEIKPFISQLEEFGDIIARLDCVVAFAFIAKKYDYVRPEFKDKRDTLIKAVRHPMLSAKLGFDYIPNDVEFSSSQKLLLITGPNMSGKSTYIRSIGLIQFLAQIGSYVPAKKANLHISDGIYTRVGANDNIVQNQSTFMVEMTEMSYISKHATDKSLIILDEVGRGTSTYDGVALAWALVENISQVIKANCLFATHYHELTMLEKILSNVKNYYFSVHPSKNLVFTHKIKRGSINRSFGVEVAKMAGIHEKVIKRAKEVQTLLEKENSVSGVSKDKLNYFQRSFELSLSEKQVSKEVDQKENVIDEQTKKYLEFAKKIKDLDLNKLTPIELFKKISDFQMSDDS
jgi:DNA mismatch repair protein MutS